MKHPVHADVEQSPNHITSLKELSANQCVKAKRTFKAKDVQ